MTIDVPRQAATSKSATASIIAILHPKGGVGRSTTVWHVAAELAMRGRRVRIEEDQGAHLTRVFDAHPLGLDNRPGRKCAG